MIAWGPWLGVDSPKQKCHYPAHPGGCEGLGVVVVDSSSVELSDSVRARPGRFGGLSVCHCKFVFYGAFVSVHRAPLAATNGGSRPGQYIHSEYRPTNQTFDPKVGINLIVNIER